VKLIEQLEQADAVLIGAPMYNFSIPSTLKAWLDNVLLLGRTAGETPSAQGTPVIVVASRGGSYAPGTPREGYEFVQNYLQAVLKGTLGLDLDFIVPELTMAPRNPAMSELIPLHEASRRRAFEEATTKAKAGFAAEQRETKSADAVGRGCAGAPTPRRPRDGQAGSGDPSAARARRAPVRQPDAQPAAPPPRGRHRRVPVPEA
jgi:multimeric flavodoxin WrbA